VRRSVEDLELLLEADGCDFEHAAYPPACDPPAGPFRMRPLEVGGVKLEVERRELKTDDFRLAVLFHCGSCLFAGPRDLAEFFRGPVARVFGMEAEPLPPRAPPSRPADDLLDDLTPPEPPRRRKAAGTAKAVAPRPHDLARRLAPAVRGQELALPRVADAVCTQLAKSAPARPASVLLIGPSGTGKTSTVEALPAALADLGFGGAHVFRVDCNELLHDSDLRKFFGAPPSYIGYVEDPPLFTALCRPRCILLLDEIEKASDAVRAVFLGLLDEGHVTAPDGERVDARSTVVAMTSNAGADDLAYRLRDLPPHGREEQDACRDHLLCEGWPPELVGRIGSIAVFDRLDEEALRGVAENAIHALAAEFGLELRELPPVLADVVHDLAAASDIGARALTYAARDLLATAFAEAAREGIRGAVALDPGPPPRVVARSPSSV